MAHTHAFSDIHSLFEPLILLRPLVQEDSNGVVFDRRPVTVEESFLVQEADLFRALGEFILGLSFYKN